MRSDFGETDNAASAWFWPFHDQPGCAMSPQQRMSPTEWGLLALLSLLWGGSFFFAKIAVGALPPLTVVLARVGLAAGALWVFLKLRGTPIPTSPRLWLSFAGMGVLNNLVPFALIFWGETVLSSGFASILNATTPVFSLLVAHTLTDDEKLAPNKVVGIVLGFAGVVVLAGNEALEGSRAGLLPTLACLGAALSYGLANVFGRRFRRIGIEPTVSAFGQIASTAAMMVPIAALADAPWRLALPSVGVWAALAGLALLSTALAYINFFRLLATAGATNTSLVTLLIPVSAVLLGTLFLSESLSPGQVGGMGLIAAGLIAIDGRAFSLLAVWVER